VEPQAVLDHIRGQLEKIEQERANQNPKVENLQDSTSKATRHLEKLLAEGDISAIIAHAHLELTGTIGVIDTLFDFVDQQQVGSLQDPLAESELKVFYLELERAEGKAIAVAENLSAYLKEKGVGQSTKPTPRPTNAKPTIRTTDSNIIGRRLTPKQRKVFATYFEQMAEVQHGVLLSLAQRTTTAFRLSETRIDKWLAEKDLLQLEHAAQSAHQSSQETIRAYERDLEILRGQPLPEASEYTAAFFAARYKCSQTNVRERYRKWPGRGKGLNENRSRLNSNIVGAETNKRLSLRIVDPEIAKRFDDWFRRESRKQSQKPQNQS
jgi:hypothetical protein